MVYPASSLDSLLSALGYIQEERGNSSSVDTISCLPKVKPTDFPNEIPGLKARDCNHRLEMSCAPLPKVPLLKNPTLKGRVSSKRINPEHSANKKVDIQPDYYKVLQFSSREIISARLTENPLIRDQFEIIKEVAESFHDKWLRKIDLSKYVNRAIFQTLKQKTIPESLKNPLLKEVELRSVEPFRSDLIKALNDCFFEMILPYQDEKVNIDPDNYKVLQFYPQRKISDCLANNSLIRDQSKIIAMVATIFADGWIRKTDLSDYVDFAILEIIKQKVIQASLNSEEQKEVPSSLNSKEQKEIPASLNSEVQKEVPASLNSEVQKEVPASLNSEEQKKIPESFNSDLIEALNVCLCETTIQHKQKESRIRNAAEILFELNNPCHNPTP